MMVSVTTRESETYLPSASEPGELAQVHDFLAARGAAGLGAVPERYLLVGAVPGDQVEVPPAVHRVLRQVVDALAAGLAVTVAPQAMTLTTQQAADLLGTSRPTVVKLLEQGAIPFTRVGAHRRVLLADVLAYRERRRAEQYAALEATAVAIDDEEDLETALVELREARHAVAERRRTRRP
jgi:excisionase family DNA binding protein